MNAKMQGTNGRGQTIVEGTIATVTTREGDRVSGEVSFVGRSHQTAVIRKGGYVYHGDTRTTEEGNTTGRP